jgi:hypothetical protein
MPRSVMPMELEARGQMGKVEELNERSRYLVGITEWAVSRQPEVGRLQQPVMALTGGAVLRFDLRNNGEGSPAESGTRKGDLLEGTEASRSTERTRRRRSFRDLGAFNTIDPICTAPLSGSLFPFFPLSWKRHSDSSAAGYIFAKKVPNATDYLGHALRRVHHCS